MIEFALLGQVVDESTINEYEIRPRKPSPPTFFSPVHHCRGTQAFHPATRPDGVLGIAGQCHGDS
jgi:hypothetical protein